MKPYAKPLFVLSLLAAYTLIQFAAAGPHVATVAAGQSASPQSKSTASPAASPTDFPTPPTSITNALAAVPPDFTGIIGQGNMNLYSWLAFVALNWPATTATCGPNLNSSILNDKGPRVWETYPEDSDVFVTPPATPAPWCAQTPTAARAAHLARLPARVQQAVRRQGVRKALFRNAKASEHLSQKLPDVDEAVGGVLTDQNGRFARYEVRVNQDEYKFLTQNNLWNAAGQNSYTQTITFPVGPSTYGPVGAIEVKAAWKVLTATEISRGRFFMTQAVVYNDDQTPPSPSPGANPVTLGLVGFHIMHKTKSQPNWIWSTFEHADNLTPPPGSLLGAKASFRNPDCPPATCPPNAQTAASPYVELGPTGKPLNKPVQVSRVNPVDDSTAAQYNAAFQKLLAGSVWANYRLISTQWHGEFGPLPKPAFLANPVLETFNQTPSPPSDGPVAWPSPGYTPFNVGVATSSCMKCHSQATTASQTNPKPADFSFLMGNAQ